MKSSASLVRRDPIRLQSCGIKPSLPCHSIANSRMIQTARTPSPPPYSKFIRTGCRGAFSIVLTRQPFSAAMMDTNRVALT